MYKKLVSLMLFLGIMFSQKPLMAQNNPLASYRWQNRLLLVFVPKVEDQRLSTIQQTLKEVECEFKDRDLLLGVFTANAPSRIGNDLISSYDEAQLRANYGVKYNQFAVILIGKDGQPKRELSEVPEIERIFGQIDNMPMRQQEMSNRPNSCN
ncbi:MAG: DUF4174 domain-containing protein [Crocosphaera sp.]|nr:DUF4174 domain-containing protein [Crocosphaera sp.]